MTASTFRWLVIDTLHHRTGLRPPKFDFSRLGDRVEAFDLLIEIHYRYYQFYANTLVAGTFSYVAWRISAGGFAAALAWCDLAFVVLAPAFFAGSRDTLRRYYERSGRLLRSDSTRPSLQAGTLESRGGVQLVFAMSEPRLGERAGSD